MLRRASPPRFCYLPSAACFCENERINFKTILNIRPRVTGQTELAAFFPFYFCSLPSVYEQRTMNYEHLAISYPHNEGIAKHRPRCYLNGGKNKWN